MSLSQLVLVLGTPVALIPAEARTVGVGMAGDSSGPTPVLIGRQGASLDPRWSQCIRPESAVRLDKGVEFGASCAA